MKKTFLEFRIAKGITDENFTVMTAEQKAELYNEYNTELKAYIETLEKRVDDSASKTEMALAVEELKNNRETEMKLVHENMKEIALRLKSMSETPTKLEAKKGLRQYLEDNSSVLKEIKEAGKLQKSHKGFSIDVQKGTQGASDIGGRDYLGTIETDIESKPVRRASILDLFERQSVSTETIKYWEQEAVIRDGKFVVACAPSVHDTKVTFAPRTVELAKIRDIVDICIDMLEDYSFVEGQVRQLVDESISLTAEYELLLGLSIASTDMLSINSIASEFNASNPVANFALSIQLPTIGDLTAAMKSQINTFGQQNKFIGNVLIMNETDKITYLHSKDANGNYLFPNFVFGATDMLNGMQILTSPLVPQNTLYVFDSTKGKILDRKRLTVTASFENKDNIEHELVTFVAVERLQFHVRLINRDAFMKCSDVAAALVAITKP